ncbi:MAG: 16S rRNA (cytosine(967)-C(5))-methyltransferase RsmB [Sedimentibacter sp.]|uniref:16S rRNA (cytosine(967)-C(5))-methyltransferase RsmB n=1 Tax=Sedimentibacter sp. TaxID=1960295 RepID=UPI0031584C89
MDGYRAKAIETLKKIFKDKSYSNIVINNDIKAVDERQHAIFRKSVLGVVENIMFIDWIINQVSSTKTKKMETDVLTVLRLAVYQLFFLDNSHENIVVNESVQYIKDAGNVRASKFVNAVLRNASRQKEDILKKADELPLEEKLSIKYSYPPELVRRWTAQFGKHNIEEVLKSNNDEARLEARVNTLKVSREKLIEMLASKGINAEKTRYSKKGITILNPSDIDRTEEYRSGLFSIQSESSMLAGEVLNPLPGSYLVDMCAAPGGKSLNAAEIMKNTGTVLSRDIYSAKLSLIERERDRLGITCLKTEEYDATRLDERLIEKADFVIADVPCTGLGIIRRKPEIKYSKTDSDMKDIVKIQYRILENASRYLKKGGHLVYSTCTTNREENLDLVKRFIQENRGFELEDFSDLVHEGFESAKSGYMEIYPHVHGMDGFFIAKITRI